MYSDDTKTGLTPRQVVVKTPDGKVVGERLSITEQDGTHKGWYEEAKGQTQETLPEFVRHLAKDYNHDYGTICHAMAAAASGAAYAINSDPDGYGGISDFQAGAVMLEFARHWKQTDSPIRFLEYDTLLYPQYEHIYKELPEQLWAWLYRETKKRLADSEMRKDGHKISAEVERHWKRTVAGIPPFGFVVNVEKQAFRDGVGMGYVSVPLDGSEKLAGDGKPAEKPALVKWLDGHPDLVYRLFDPAKNGYLYLVETPAVAPLNYGDPVPNLEVVCEDGGESGPYTGFVRKPEPAKQEEAPPAQE